MARRARAAGQNLVRVAGESNRLLYMITWSAMALLIFALQATFEQMNFSDSAAYLELIAATYHFPAPDWYVFEPLSKLLFMVLMDLTGSAETSVAWGHYYISVIFLLGCLAIFPPAQGNWRGLLMAFALYGPQLAFVTIRATPAYMLAALAVLDAARGRYRCFAWLGAALLFHVSSALAIVPIAALLVRTHLGAVQRLQEPKVLLALLAAASVVFALAGSFIFSGAQTLLDSIPFLSKYTIFLVGLGDDGGLSSIQTFAFGHFILLAVITAFFFTYLIVRDPITRLTAIFVVAGYVFYLFMFFAFSPVAAFRQTAFWLLPAFSLFPWHRVGWKDMGQLPFLAGAVGIFAFQFSRVLV